MAEFVQQSIEEMVGELHEMQTAELFDGSEIRYNYDACPVSFTWLLFKCSTVSASFLPLLLIVSSQFEPSSKPV